jgi:hypothetical protein
MIPAKTDTPAGAVLPNCITDGFTYLTGVQYLPERFYPVCLAQMQILRRANTYRPRWFCLPDQMNRPLAAYGSPPFEYQIHIVPGAYLWGMTFAVISLGETVPPTTADVLVQITDACTGIPLFSDYPVCEVAAVPGGENPRFSIAPVLLTQPRLILEPGLINVELTNRAAIPRDCQLLLMFAEPCDIETYQSLERTPSGELGRGRYIPGR